MSSTRIPPAWWFDTQQPVPVWAKILAQVFGALTAARRWLYARRLLRAHTVPVPVIIVGGVVVGGSGKTPLSLALIARLQAEGFRVGVASRGYGRSQAKQARWVDATTPAQLAGDEPLLIARRSGVPVRVDSDRVAAAHALVDSGCNVIVCDDGLQHYRLARSIEIEVSDSRRGYGNQRLLPAGPLREPLQRAARCDFRVVNTAAAQAFATAHSTQWPMTLQVQQVQALQGGAAFPLQAFAGQRVHAVAGIGEPARFFKMLENAGIEVIAHPFADHHQFSAGDLLFDDALPVLMTEKDAVKCADFANPRLYYVPVQAHLSDAFWQALLQRVRAHGEKP